jgi:hypothetical protein
MAKATNTNQSGDATTHTNFDPDYRIVYLSLLGLAGFIAGCLILFYPEVFGKEKSVFHEIAYQPRELAAPMVDHLFDSLTTAIATKSDSLKQMAKPSTSSDTTLKATLQAKIKSETAIVEKLSAYRKHWENLTEVDTLSFSRLNNALHFNLTPDNMDAWDSNDTLSASFPISYSFKDPVVPFRLYGTSELKLKPYSNDLAFIAKYPSAGIWILLILIFCSFCFIVISTSVYLLKKTVRLFEENQITGHFSRYYYIAVVCILVALILLSIIWRSSFYDNSIVKDLFFMQTLNVSMSFVAFFGYLAGAFCLAGFIHMAAMLGYFAREIKTNKKEIDTQQAALDVKKELRTATAEAETALTNTVVKQTKDEAIYESLRNTFSTYFVLSAAILSIMVLCTGSLYNTVNSLDFIKLLSDDWGYSPARSDFVYLYGGLHTVILLLVYVPAKMRFSEINFTRPSSGAAAPGVAPPGGKWWNAIKDPFGQLKDVLIAASPLLASLIQSLFDLLFN